jgi:hypothetical protein
MVPKRDALVIRAFAVWTVYVWGTRIWNVIGDDGRGFAFKAVHVALAVVSVAFAVATWFVVARNRRASRVGSGTADLT